MRPPGRSTFPPHSSLWMYSGVTPYFTWFLIPIFVLKLSQAGATPVVSVSPLATDSSARGVDRIQICLRSDSPLARSQSWLHNSGISLLTHGLLLSQHQHEDLGSWHSPQGRPHAGSSVRLPTRPWGSTPDYATLASRLSPKPRPQVFHRIPLPNCGLCQVPGRERSPGARDRRWATETQTLWGSWSERWTPLCGALTVTCTFAGGPRMKDAE